MLSKETMIPIEELLSGNKAGQRINIIYKSTNSLDEKLRTMLCDIIISYIENMSAW